MALIAASGLVVLLAVRAAEPRPGIVLGAAIGAASVAGIWWEVRAGRPFSYSNFVYASCLLTFSVRPLYLLGNYDQLTSYRGPRSAVEFLKEIRAQEIVEFFTTRYPGDPANLIFSAEMIGATFLFAFIAGRLVGSAVPAQPPGFRLVVHQPRPQVVQLAVVLLTAVGFIGQSLIVRGAGGVGAALGNLENQGTLQQAFSSYVMAMFAVVAMLVWAAFGSLRGVSLVAFCALTAEVVIFGLLTGSRSIALLPLVTLIVVIHYCRRPFRAKELALGAVALVLIASFLLGVRQVSAGRSIAESAKAGLTNADSASVAANDLSQFDAVVMMAGVVPDRLEHQEGRQLLAGLSSFIPRALYPAKPENNDVWFREQVWGTSRPAGRPYTLAGGLWLDFKWVGVAIGGMILGVLCGCFRGDSAQLMTPDRALVAAALFNVVGGLVDGVYSQAVTLALSLGIPLAVVALMFSVGRVEHSSA